MLAPNGPASTLFQLAGCGACWQRDLANHGLSAGLAAEGSAPGSERFLDTGGLPCVRLTRSPEFGKRRPLSAEASPELNGKPVRSHGASGRRREISAAQGFR